MVGFIIRRLLWTIPVLLPWWLLMKRAVSRLATTNREPTSRASTEPSSRAANRVSRSLGKRSAAAVLAERARLERSDPDRLIALPLSIERQRERGYNQAAEIARLAAARTGIPLLSAGVRRVRAAPPQAVLPWAARERNVRGAFACDADLAGLRVAVIDDVMTTGASLSELARTLRAAGATRIENWVVARTLPQR